MRIQKLKHSTRIASAMPRIVNPSVAYVEAMPRIVNPSVAYVE